MTTVAAPRAPASSASPERLRSIRHMALDMDGTIYKGGTLFPFTLPFLQRLKSLGIGYTFLTNNPSKSVNDYLAHLQKMGLSARREELHTSTQATIDCLRTHLPMARRLFLLGTPSMIAEFEAAGFVSTRDDAGDEPDAIVAAFDTTLTFSRLGRACWWVRQGKPYFATNPDFVCPTDQPTILVDCGSVCAAIEKAAGRRPDITLGKPDPEMLSGILHRHRLKAHEVAMVGDRIYTDILMAQRAGALGVLVLSGEATAEEAARAEVAPDLVVPSLAELGGLLESLRFQG
ncbi:MAG: HAD-IIA family hydrolase [Opitutaceae bacterium]|nr:HAD-IIA family hydrolase [Opitutaceae bacterium]